MGKERSTENYVWYKSKETYLGGGAFGAAYVGKDRRTGNTVAVKVCKLVEGNEYVEDVDILKSLSSPYITKYYAAEEVTNGGSPKLAIIMELADGSLASELRKEGNRNGISKSEFLILVDNCVKALEYLHFKKLTHRDIKPPNVLVFRNKEAPKIGFKLCDFGTSRMLETRNQLMSTVVGTPAYLPTNVIDPAKSDYEREYTKDDLDIWSTACCFFEAATGRLPFVPHVDAGGQKCREEIVKLLRGRPPNTVCAYFNEEDDRYVYQEDLPQQHKSYTRSFRGILCRYFQLLFSRDKEYLQLEKLSSLSNEMVSIQEHEYYCLNTSTVESYCDTSSSINFPRETFLDATVKVVQRIQGDLDNIRIAAASQKVREALNDDTIEILIPQADYRKPLLALLLPFQLSQESSQIYCVAALRDTAEGVTLELQDNACVKAMKKADCTVEQLVEDEALPSLAAYLLGSDAGVNITDKSGGTPLAPDIERVNSDMIDMHIHRDVDVSAADGDALRLPDNKEPDVNSSDMAIISSLDKTALKSAVRLGKNDVVEMLVEQGADLDAADENGWTPIIEATIMDHVDVVKTLVQNGANVIAKDKNGFTALHWACVQGRIQAAACLIDGGADLNIMDNNDRTPLTAAVHAGKNDMIELLINRGADVNAAGSYGRTPLMEAVLNDRLDVAKTLVQNGANLVARDKYESTALHWACVQGRIQAAAYLIDSGADLNIRDKNCGTPLAAATNSGKNDMVELLVARGADVNAAGNFGYTPLITAALLGHLDVVKTLVQNGANVKAKEKGGGCTALHFACQRGHVEIVEYLLENGADINARTLGGKTPLNLAEDSNRAEIAQLLQDRGARQPGFFARTLASFFLK